MGSGGGFGMIVVPGGCMCVTEYILVCSSPVFGIKSGMVENYGEVIGGVGGLGLPSVIPIRSCWCCSNGMS